MISAKAKKHPHFKSLLRFVDWLWYSYSGQELTKWGVEGQTYTFSKGTYKRMSGYYLEAYGFNKQADIEQGWAEFEKQCKIKGCEKYIKTANTVYQARKKK